MIIRKLKIEDFEDVERLELTFDSSLIRLDMPGAGAAAKAVAVALKSVLMKDFAEDLSIRLGTSISADIDINGAWYFVTARGSPKTGSFDHDVRDAGGKPVCDFYERIRVNEEEDRLSWFRCDPSDPYSRRLKHYREADKYYPQGVFSAITDGIGCTRTFRALLSEYIKGFRSYCFPIRKDRRIALQNDGEFVLTDTDGTQIPINLTGEERELFEYLCFLHLNDFWRRVESVRNINHVSRPLIVSEAAF